MDGDHAVYEVMVPSSWQGKTVGELDIRRKYNINILGTRHNDKLDLSVTPNTMFTSEHTLMVLGTYRDVQKCFKL